MNLATRLAALIAVAMAAFAAPVAMAEEPAPPPQKDLFLSFQPLMHYVTWEEDAGNGLTLKEDGFLYGVGFDAGMALDGGWSLHAQGQIYGGTIDYDGYVMNIFGQTRPYDSETSYLGLQADADIAYDLDDDAAFDLSPFAGLGFRHWLRRLDDGGDTGYDEYWYSIHARAGLRAQWLTAPDTRWYAWGAVLLPVYNYEIARDVPLARDDSISLKPGRRVGWQFEAGYIHRNMIAAAYIEALNFGESDFDSSGGFYQPESEKRVYGLKFGFVF